MKRKYSKEIKKIARQEGISADLVYAEMQNTINIVSLLQKPHFNSVLH